MKKKSVRILKIVLLVAIVVVVLGLVWVRFGYSKNCQSQECFDAALEACDRAEFVKQGSVVFEYDILGKKRNNCKVDVEVLSVSIAESDEARLVGKKMVCMIPCGIVIAPESQIGDCHGLLKEELQDMIIENLHRQLVQNIGEINEGLGF